MARAFTTGSICQSLTAPKGMRLSLFSSSNSKDYNLLVLVLGDLAGL